LQSVDADAGNADIARISASARCDGDVFALRWAACLRKARRRRKTEIAKVLSAGAEAKCSRFAVRIKAWLCRLRGLRVGNTRGPDDCDPARGRCRALTDRDQLYRNFAERLSDSSGTLLQALEAGCGGAPRVIDRRDRTATRLQRVSASKSLSDFKVTIPGNSVTVKGAAGDQSSFTSNRHPRNSDALKRRVYIHWVDIRAPSLELGDRNIARAWYLRKIVAAGGSARAGAAPAGFLQGAGVAETIRRDTDDRKRRPAR